MIEDCFDEQVHCPHYTECNNEKETRCYTHAYILCSDFNIWYDNGGREQVKEQYEKRKQN
jgi:hypothetical protein